MPIQTINVGNYIDDPRADEIRDAFIKCNANFSWFATGIWSGIPTLAKTTNYALTTNDVIVGMDASIDNRYFTLPPCLGDAIGKAWLLVRLDTSANELGIGTDPTTQDVVLWSQTMQAQGFLLQQGQSVLIYGFAPGIYVSH